MEEALNQFFEGQGSFVLAAMILAILAVLAKSADKLVGESVVLSERSGLPKVIIGATIVSLGTTAPEAAVSVLAALQGEPDVALGNAIGSIICDTGLILGIACLIMPLKLPRQIVKRQGWLQFGAGWLLVAACWPWATGGNPFQTGGNLPQTMGFVFLGLLAVYLYLSVRWARVEGEIVELEEFEKDVDAPMWIVIVKLVVAIALVVASSRVLLPAVQIAAERLHVPQAIVAATLIALGTSMPELVTAVTAARKDHGDLAIGNIIGADILNVLFVAGMSAAVTPDGLDAPKDVFRLLFPAMLLVLVVFRVGAACSTDRLRRPFGAVLLAAYAIYLAMTVLVFGNAGT